MRFHLAAFTMLTLLVACASGPDPRKRPLAANPSAIVAADLAFARLAQDKGQWTAFRETAHKEAVMFVPQRVKARDWLSGQVNPEAALTWQPHAVFSSCDGTAGATTGGWQKANGDVGYYTLVWLRDEKGKLLWVLDNKGKLTEPRVAPEFISSKKAKCGAPLADVPVAADAGGDMMVGMSKDRTMSWTAVSRPDGSRRVILRLWDGTAMETVVDDQVEAQR